jgi:UDPglucose--hexose-1-phosphate uridylyltransferase
MSEFRQDLLSGRWSIIAGLRQKRPTDYIHHSQKKPAHACPFCPGNEESTPTEIMRIANKSDGGWQVRVVPNKYPILIRAAATANPRNSIEKKVASGYHEVIIEQPAHSETHENMNLTAMADVFSAYFQRIAALQKDSTLTYGIIFKNRGGFAGATIAHAHSQLMAMPFLPPDVAQIMARSRTYFAEHHQCITCASIQKENDGLVFANSHFAVVSPHGAMAPYHLRILPKTHSPVFRQPQQDVLLALAEANQIVNWLYDNELNEVPYNMVIQGDLLNANASDHAHWYIDYFPKMSNLAGFELGSGVFVNPVAPEEAAVQLRKALQRMDYESA